MENVAGAVMAVTDDFPLAMSERLIEAMGCGDIDEVHGYVTGGEGDIDLQLYGEVEGGSTWHREMWKEWRELLRAPKHGRRLWKLLRKRGDRMIVEVVADWARALRAETRSYGR